MIHVQIVDGEVTLAAEIERLSALLLAQNKEAYDALARYS